jgi:sulfur carrier protein
MSVTILLNGEPRSVAAALSVSQLVESLGLRGKRIAVERNGEIVPKSRYASTRVDAGDKLEIVAAVGGG